MSGTNERSTLTDPQILAALLEYASDGIAVFDRDLRFKQINERLAEINGFPVADHIGKSVRQLLPTLAPTAEKIAAQILATGEPVSNHEFSGVTAASPGVMRYWNESWYPVRDAQGGTSGFCVVVQEITDRKQAANALRSSEERFRLLAETMLQGVIHRSASGEIIAMNPAAERILGKTRAELLGSSSMRETHDTIRESGAVLPDQEHPSMVALRTGQHVRGVVMEVFNPEVAAYRWISIDAIPVCRPGETRPSEVYTVFEDITERKRTEEEARKRAEEALRMSEQEFRSLAESMPQIVWATRPDGWNIYFNQKWVDYTGMTLEESYGHGWNTPFHPDDKQRAWKAWQRATQHNERYALECRLRRADGAYRWWLVRGEPMLGANGRIVKWFGTCTDIEEIKHAEAALQDANDLLEQRVAERTAALRESEQIYRSIGESMKYGVWICDPSGRNIYASPSFLELVGLTQEQCSNFGWGAVLHPEDSERTIAAWKECVRSGAAWDIEHRFRGVDGEWHPILARGAPVRNARGEIVCWAGINLDISRMKRTEHELAKAKTAAEEANRQKDQFIAVLGHELRNPLAPIRNSVALLKRLGPPDPALQRAREMIDRQVDHIARLLDDMLDVSRVSTGKIILRKAEVDLIEVVLCAVEDHRPILESAGLKLSFNAPNDSIFVIADSARITQIVGNLLVNATKFTDRGGAVDVSVAMDSGSQAIVRVIDTGIGMDEATLARIFQPFAQADRSLNRSRGGLGLGLALVKGLVDMHGGTVKAASAGHGQGSQFTITLPSVLPKPEVAKIQFVPAAMHPKRILIIEDNKDAAETLKLLLEHSGNLVSMAHSGPEGLEKAVLHLPEVILCDIGLPGMNGYEVARAIRQTEKLKSVYLVAMTGYGQDEDRKRALDAGFDHHLTKPADPEALERLLAQ